MIGMPPQAGPVGRFPARYELLDGLRGLAALGVVVAHLGFADIGHEAVMIFFVISGYCITASARACERRGMSFVAFMQRRLRRIYPPYLAAVAFYVVTRLVKLAMGGENDLDRPWTHWLQNLTLTQWVSVPFDPIGWPADNPVLFVAAFWSLNYEEQFYLLVALAMLVASRLGASLAVQIATLGALGLAWNLLFPDGWITGLFIEYFAHFSLGSALYFAQCEFRSPAAPRLLAVLLCAVGAIGAGSVALAVAQGVPVPRAHEELLVLTVFVAILLLLRPASRVIAAHPLWRPVAALGTISYSLYLIHQFNLTLMAAAADAAGLAGLPRAIAMIGLMLAIATAFWFLFERPWLNQAPTSPARVAR
jgi:peptidoglycan/LPS O-acetylase OafA/YrhL